MGNYKDDASFRNAFYTLKQSMDFFDDSYRQAPNTPAGSISRKYMEKCKWMFADFKTNPMFSRQLQDEFTKEMRDSVPITENIAQLCLKLTVKQKEEVEWMLTKLILGEEVTVILNSKT